MYKCFPFPALAHYLSDSSVLYRGNRFVQFTFSVSVTFLLQALGRSGRRCASYHHVLCFFSDPVMQFFALVLICVCCRRAGNVFRMLFLFCALVVGISYIT
ncbi:hypothetical protein, unlikely [Trypanosoma brucei gambiense DAL972]|uniref:Uncharacterized protein n=1 Tax=Trypanosoma brucei gambiense (strain MHOM/CI/86/DAL972) TaxID=679716 RepID=D0A5Y9_TRYB9|nr:hypothetical protein, unlikely [Trypanosoma brucei gambiense DAL972]CBH17090.1 hypothetical protein, unlikely [Trypanosoma brucei gambiense DAL972]|eukprot:XP_011779354.1 hypothetical protein, unlikely [Trypanosoma brucei gambiense DAL972]